MFPGLSGHLLSEYFLDTQRSSARSSDASAFARAWPLLARWRRTCARLGPASGLRALFDGAATPLLEALGFERASDVEHLREAIAATLHPGPSRRVALVVTGWGQRLDSVWRLAVTEAGRRSAPWCLLLNGTHVRIVDAGRLFARRFVEFDIELALEDEASASLFWSVSRAESFAGPCDGFATRLHGLVAGSERHASGVCRSLKTGVLAASADVLGALSTGRRSRVRVSFAECTAALPFVRDEERSTGEYHSRSKCSDLRDPDLDNASGAESLTEAFEQALTIVYRILFLLFAESRGLVPLWHPVYRESYSVDAVRAAAERPGPVVGLWDALRAVGRMAHSGCRAGDLLVTPFNGRLFAPARTPLAERKSLDDEAARRAILALTTRPSKDRAGRERICYRDLGVEQLGAIYETLLDYEPRIAWSEQKHPQGRGVRQEQGVPPASAPSRPVVSLEPGSGVRKATGTFYTPEALVNYLVRRTLGPLVHESPPERILSLRVVDPAMGSGAFLVAACRYLASAYESALVQTGGCTATDIGESERMAIRRTVAERCLFGVDLNPMAVQLARLSLWLTTLAGDRPLTFLDHHLQVGDSLLGSWLGSLIRLPTRRRRSEPAAETAQLLFSDLEMRKALEAVLPVRFSLESIPDDTLEQVRSKERALSLLNRRDSTLSKWKRVADLWCACWFAGEDARLPSSAFRSLMDHVLQGRGALACGTAEAYLDAASVIASQRRFFHWELEFPEAFFTPDGVRLSNPGFDAVIGNPPWDMVRADAGSATDRTRARRRLSGVLRFTRDSGVYEAQSSGHSNSYQLFLERAMALARSGGRLGMVLPSGLATDLGSVALRRRLFAQCDLDALLGFDNQRAVFPIHRSVRFLLLTGTMGSATRSIACRLGERDPGVLDSLGEGAGSDREAGFPVRISPALLDRISAGDLAIPDIRTPLDLAIVERAAALFPPLGSQNGWGARFGRELNATDDRRHFRPAGRGLPIVEGKHIRSFAVDLSKVRHSIARDAAGKLVLPQRFTHQRLAYRDVASAGNRTTLIAAILPAGCLSTHTLFCLRTQLPLRHQLLLCGLFNSYVVNFLVRLRVTTHVTTTIVEALPIPPLETLTPAAFEIAALARLLHREPRPAALARLQALAAHLYQLSEEEFSRVLGTFPLVAKLDREEAMKAFLSIER